MEFEKISNLSDEELKSQEAKTAEQLFRLRFQKSLGNTEGIKKLRGLKLEIARIKTVARQRELASRNGGGQSAAVGKAAKPAAKAAKTAAKRATKSTAEPAATAKTRTKAKKD